MKKGWNGVKMSKFFRAPVYDWVAIHTLIVYQLREWKIQSIRAQKPTKVSLALNILYYSVLYSLEIEISHYW